MKPKSLIPFLRQFFLQDLWLIHAHDPKWLRALKKFLSILIISIREFIRDGVSNRASALTYSTLLSCVPILAILFAISRGFGVGGMLEHELQEALGAQEAVSTYLMQFVDSYLDQTRNGLFLGIGLVALLVTIVNLTSNIETAFNDIWEVRTPRTLYRKLTDYFSIFLLLPIFIVLSGGVSIFIGTMVKEMHDYMILGNMMKFLIRLIPFFMSWLMFTGLYIFMPNTKVHFFPALIAGIVAGTGYQFFQFLYINGQFSLSKYNAIYGSFAALPLLLLWLQISWTIILFGVEVNYAIQNARNFSYTGDKGNHMSRHSKDFVAIIVTSLIYKRFARGESPLTADEISAQSQFSIRLVHQALNQLQQIQLIHTSPEENGGEIHYHPSMDVHVLTVNMLLHRIYTDGAEVFALKPAEIHSKVWKMFQSATQEETEKHRPTTENNHFFSRLLIDLPN